MVPPRDPATQSKQNKSGKRDTAGKGWFDLPAQVMIVVVDEKSSN
jgi:hypothetical protein